MSEQTPRQKRTDQLLDKAGEAYREVNDNLKFINKSVQLGGICEITLLQLLVDTVSKQQAVNRHLLQAVRNMAEAPAFNKQEAS